ncbi:MFS transporter [Desulfallas sp. Bu1-1]|uniref:MFS transporter n=1 Tax=Desulfallas sp. Bu1-1 TaxID=2787620 RepID=UPI00189E0737|nr:MFS transporter [Desulfallas sp. Bu1-1]MBF7084707.1 MFS transporter [Desulfallas sp. Bu1-1]
MTAKRFHHAYLIVWVCCSMSLCVGITYNTAGIFFPSVIKELGVSRGALALYMTGIGLMSALFLPIAGKLMKGKNVRSVLSIVVLIHAITTAAMALCANVYHFYVASIFLGMTMSFFLYVATPTLIGRWFADRVGFFVGLCFAFTAGGAIVFNPIAGYVIANFGWRMGYVAMGLCSLVLVFIPVVLFVRGNPEDVGLKPHGIEKVVTGAGDVRFAGASVSDAFKSLTIIPVLLYVVSVALFSDLYVYLPSYASSKGMGMALLAMIGSSAMIGTVIGKIAFGALNDKSPIGTLALCGLCGVIGVLTMLYLGVANPTFFLIGAFIYGLAYSTPTVQSALLIKRIFGLREYPQIYSVIMMIYALSTATGQSLWGFITDRRGGDYTLSFLLVAALAVGFAVFSITALLMRKRVVWTSAPEV